MLTFDMCIDRDDIEEARGGGGHIGRFPPRFLYTKAPTALSPAGSTLAQQTLEEAFFYICHVVAKPSPSFAVDRPALPVVFIAAVLLRLPARLLAGAGARLAGCTMHVQ
jgi:hypothetical protein